MFYDKEVELWEKGKRTHIGGGVYKDGEDELVKSMMVDIQPYSSEEAMKDYGYSVKCTNVMFCDVEDLKISTNNIKYRNKIFGIVKIIEWDSYIEVLLNEL